jgi:hypothetical protein
MLKENKKLTVPNASVNFSSPVDLISAQHRSINVY